MSKNKQKRGGPENQERLAFRLDYNQALIDLCKYIQLTTPNPQAIQKRVEQLPAYEQGKIDDSYIAGLLLEAHLAECIETWTEKRQQQGYIIDARPLPENQPDTDVYFRRSNLGGIIAVKNLYNFRTRKVIPQQAAEYDYVLRLGEGDTSLLVVFEAKAGKNIRTNDISNSAINQVLDPIALTIPDEQAFGYVLVQFHHDTPGFHLAPTYGKELEKNNGVVIRIPDKENFMGMLDEVASDILLDQQKKRSARRVGAPVN